MVMPKSTKRYQKNQKYRLLINSFSIISLVAIVLVVLKTDAYIWLGMLTIPVIFGIPTVATLYLDYFLTKRIDR